MGLSPKPPYYEVRPYYSLAEVAVAEILGLSEDTVRRLFEKATYGPVLIIDSQHVRQHRKNYRTIRIPHETLLAFIAGNTLAPRGKLTP